MNEVISDKVYRRLVYLTLSIIGVGVLFYHYVEHFSWVDAYYFSVVTLTTVGYGDLSPQTDIGKLFTTVYILSGVGVITAFISYSLKKRQARFNSRHPEKNLESESRK